MRRPYAVLAVVLLAVVAAPLTRTHGHPTQRAGVFLEPGEHGFDRWYAKPSLCRKTGVIPVVTQNVNVVDGDGIVSIGGNGGCRAPQNEPSIAVNPLDPQNLVAGSNDYRLCCDSEGRNDGTGWAYTSFDGGRTWINRLLPGLTVETGGHGRFAGFDSAGDPAVAFTSAGAAVYANIAFNRNSPASGITLSRSTSAAHSWRSPQLVAYANDSAVFLDKVAVATGPNHAVAVTWTRFDQSDGLFGSARLYAAVSHDDGATFGRPIRVAPGQPVSQGTAPAFAPDGALYVAYETVDLTVGADVIAYSYLRPGEKRFRLVTVAPAYDYCYPANGDGRVSLTGRDFRTSSFPAIAADTASGTVAIVWADDELGCSRAHTDSQVKLVTAHLAHRSPPRIVTSGGDKTMPAVAYRDGVITVGFYTTTFAGSTPRGLDYGYATSTDGFLEHRLSDGSSDPQMQFGGEFIGDYTAAAQGSDGVVHFVWTDSRGGDQNIYTATAP